MTIRRIAIAVACCAAIMPMAYAESLADPTRPPAAFGSSSAADAGTEAASSLQSIIRSDRGKPGAIINGEYVLLGGRVGDARLVRIGEDSVTLKSPTGTETLTLTTGVEKTPATSAVQENGKMRKDRNKEKK